MRRLIFVLLLLATACGSNLPELKTPGAHEQMSFRLRHQIKARRGDDVYVFEGYMILQGDAFVVRAFAGPGVSLFTVTRDGDKHTEKAHVPGLNNKLNLESVGLDIARAYFAGCPGSSSGEITKCTILGQIAHETHAPNGDLLTRRFPSAYKDGLLIEYLDYTKKMDRRWAKRIHLKWSGKENEMEIFLLTVEPTSSTP